MSETAKRVRIDSRKRVHRFPGHVIYWHPKMRTWICVDNERVIRGKGTERELLKKWGAR